MPTFEISGPPADCSRQITDLFEYWQSLKAGDRLPGRRDIDPLDIPRLLPNIWLLDVVQDPLRFRFRLVGTAIVTFTGRDSTGRYCDEVYTDYGNTDAYRCASACALTGRPQYRRSGVISNPDRRYAEAERIYLPLAADGHAVDMLLNMTLYHDRGASPDRRGRRAARG